MRKLTVPISEETIRELAVGETVSLSGVITIAFRLSMYSLP